MLPHIKTAYAPFIASLWLLTSTACSGVRVLNLAAAFVTKTNGSNPSR
jgi:hypothetical protein